MVQTASLSHFLAPNLRTFRELVLLFGSSFGPNSGACVTSWAQICAHFGSLCQFLRPNLGPNRESLSPFGPKLRPNSGACVTFWAHIWVQYGSLCNSFGQIWPILVACVTVWAQMWAQMESLSHFLGPDLGPFREIVSRFMPKFGSKSEAPVTFWTQIWSSFWEPGSLF